MMQTAAFLTYNKIGQDTNLQDGWHESNGRRAFVLQNTKGDGSYRNGGPIGTERRREEAGLLWAKVREVPPVLTIGASQMNGRVPPGMITHWPDGITGSSGLRSFPGQLIMASTMAGISSVLGLKSAATDSSVSFSFHW